MKRYLLILLVAISVKAESLQTLTVLNLSSTNVAGLAWVDKHGGFHALDTTNIVTEAYVSGLLEGYQIGSTILSNFVSLGNGAGVLTNDGLGNISWAILSSGGGDFMADGSVSMNGPLEFSTGTSITSFVMGFTTLNLNADKTFITGVDTIYVGTISFSGDNSVQTSAALPQTPIISDIDYAGFRQLNPLAIYIGSYLDDGTAAPLQSSDISASGSYWCQGTIGISGISVLGDDALMHPVVGGIIQ